MKLLCFAVAVSMLLAARPQMRRASHRQPAAQRAKQELLDLENHWLQVEEDPNALESILAPDFLHVVPAGIITKEEELSFMRKHPASTSSLARHFEQLHVRIYGTVGIVNGVAIAKGPGTNSKTLFTDVFAYRDGRWQAVSAQELPVGEKPR